jgi:hypothetical protein
MDKIANDLWKVLTQSKEGKSIQETAIVEVLDTILKSKKAETAFDSVMLTNNSASMYKNLTGKYASSLNKNVAVLYQAIVDTNQALRTTVGKVATALESALAEPNIAGIPISTARIETNREIEVSESMVIVQSTKDRKYWTDNAVPRLKEWNIDGYLTSLSPLDSGQLIKPSLQWQAYYLDVCSKSRRPLMFKTNRGEFVKVQITNLHTTEEPEYNNVIHITMTLKEYNPYIVSDNPEENKIAIRSIGV